MDLFVASFDIKDWYIWPCQSYPGSFNMQADHIFAREMFKTLDRPLLRFFTWDPYCISLGYHQNPGIINQELCRSEGFDIVKRPTGGRAILHSEEMTYSIIYPFGRMDVMDFYRLVHLPFVEALKNLGINAELEPVQANFQHVYKTEKAQVCFATSAKYEVEIEGKKIIGSAQRIYENSILQHGSVLFGQMHERLIEFLSISPQTKEKMKNYLRVHTSNIWNFLPGLTAFELSQKVQEQFINLFQIRFTSIGHNKELKSVLETISHEPMFSTS